jgi:hypothetical protein
MAASSYPRPWRDVSSYSQGQKERLPRTFSLALPSFSVVVTRHLHYPPDVWVLRCPELGMDTHPLESSSLELAQFEAMKLVREKLAANLKALEDTLTVSS